ncbi:hypothetical protein ACFSBZ_14430 [Amnibacterium flavum]|uniref:SAF domain-containing protein n=1 Tax=Amnibacterium flavum TaxID=2173173 RepID=A0A2V1HXD7_9MICO|nr:hypothetical protein [Amnibacterium flavum]PVZ95940.1 hypothetical protein DDQ50_05630 [Amnibacterium flavum]
MTAPVPRKARRFDVRLLIGAVIVVASIVGVALVVGAFDRSVMVYQAARPLSVGHRLVSGDLALAEVRLGALESRYLRAEALPDDGAVVTRQVDAGELVPVASLGSDAGAGLSTVVVRVEAPVASGVRAGAAVDVWSSPRDEAGRFGPPSVIAADSSVVSVIDESGVGSISADTGVELLVPSDDVAELLSAIANGDAISLVPSGSPIGAAS